MEKSIYMKSEPAGRIGFCELDEDQIILLKDSLKNNDLDEELEELRYDGMDNEAEGVFNNGGEGDFGNEGKISFSEDIDQIGPSIIDGKTFKDGTYAVIMRLSKCSLEFDMSIDETFDKNEFLEISVPVKLPSNIKHELYGEQNSNIIVGFNYLGNEIEEYEGEIEDRGFEDQFIFFGIANGISEIIYSNYEGEEYWNNNYNF